VFVGRHRELDVLTAALASARTGEPKTIMVHGDAGIGKSSLIVEFLRGRPDVPAIAIGCVEAEAALAYGVIRQLAAATVAVWPRALSGRGLLTAGPGADDDPLAVGEELRALLAGLARRQPVTVVIEDMQWADRPSADALLFACRRPASDPVLVVLTCVEPRTGGLGEGWRRHLGDDRRARVLRLRGLDAAEVGLLCEALGRGGLTERAIRRIADFSGGNPLFALALLDELPDDVLAAPDGLSRVPRSLAGLILPRVAGLSRQARELVAAAAVLGEHCPLADAGAVAGLHDPRAGLNEAARAGVLTERIEASGALLSFGHALIRRVVYDDLGQRRRQRMHARAARIATGTAALAHRAAAAQHADPELAAALAATGASAAEAGHLLMAASCLHQAATVTERGPAREDLVLSAFELQIMAADVAAAQACRPLVEQLPGGVRKDTALGKLAVLSARPLEAGVLLRAAWNAGMAVGPHGEAALWLGHLAVMSGTVADGEMWLDRALHAGTGDEPWYDTARCLRSFVFVLRGDPASALRMLHDVPDSPARVPAARSDALAYRGMARLCAGDVRTGAEDLGQAVARVAGGCCLQFPGTALEFLAEAEFRLGSWDDGQRHAELAVSLARDCGADHDLAFAHAAAAQICACRGDWAAGAVHMESAERSARAFGGLASISAGSARCALAFARGDPRQALDGAAMALTGAAGDDIDCPTALWWRPVRIWALTQTGELGLATADLESFAVGAAETGEPCATVFTAYLTGVLRIKRGDLDLADEVLRAGRLAASDAPLPFHRALLDLEHGRCLARLQRRGAAIDAVRTARAVFSDLGARPFVQASDTELNALGLRHRHGADPRLPYLTRQEARVARLVASGMSNREAAAALYLSPKTVEYHLANVFAKLGVRSRFQLAIAVDSAERPGA
jgi:DNA-binding CsgD family transcriptional regulator